MPGVKEESEAHAVIFMGPYISWGSRQTAPLPPSLGSLNTVGASDPPI